MTNSHFLRPGRLSPTFAFFHANRNGFLVSVVVAVAAKFLSEHHGAPAMLMALLLGIAFHFLAEEGTCVAGISFTSRTVLRIGVALLGARISLELMIGLGPNLIALIVAGVLLTTLFGLLGANLLGRGWRLGLLTGGSVAICGASAAMAIAAVLPKIEHSERNLIFTVLCVTVLSTIAMIVYPVLTQIFDLGELATGVFIGGTIHDVAQVVGAGFSISDETGETATLVKLIRVTMLAPVVLIISLCIRHFGDRKTSGDATKRPPLMPFLRSRFSGVCRIEFYQRDPPNHSGHYHGSLKLGAVDCNLRRRNENFARNDIGGRWSGRVADRRRDRLYSHLCSHRRYVSRRLISFT